jgi:hypothetical protein
VVLSPRAAVLKGQQNGQKINTAYERQFISCAQQLLKYCGKKHKLNKYL